MKQLLMAIFVICSFTVSAQTPYNDRVQFNLGDTADEAGVVYKRRGRFEVMIYNQRIKTISVQVRVAFLSNTVELERFIKPYIREFSLSNNTFVLASNGTIVGDRAAMRALYGVLDPADSTNQTYLTSAFGGDSLTTPCMGEYDYLTSLFDQNYRLHAIIRSLAQRAASEGKLD